MNDYAAVIAALIGFGISAVSGIVIVPLLRRLKIGQNINKIGPVWHMNKQGTPTMGGVMFILAAIAALLIILPTQSGSFVAETNSLLRLVSCVLLAVALAAIGFMDDFIKVVKKRNLGLNEGQKTILQMVVIAAFLVSLYFCGDRSTVLRIPFTPVSFDMGLFYYPFMMFAIYAAVNAVNFTDGVDGLAGSVTLVVCCFFIIACRLYGNIAFSIYAAALAGGLLGFLLWNFHPAKVIMGDTGSMFLGGAFVGLAFGMRMPLLMIPIGIIYLIEALTVVIQMTYFKITKGKRLFKMTPIHHHFEMSGWSEAKIVTVFSTITIASSVLTLLWLISNLYL